MKGNPLARGPVVGLAAVVLAVLVAQIAVAGGSDQGTITSLQRQINALKAQVGAEAKAAQTKGKRGRRGRRGRRGPPGLPGTQGPAGLGFRWALVENDGDIAASSGGVTKVTFGGQDPSQYLVDFGTDVTNRPILVTSSSRFAGLGVDSVDASPCGGNDTTPGSTACPMIPGGDNNHTVFVLTTRDGFLNSPEGFYIVVLP